MKTLKYVPKRFASAIKLTGPVDDIWHSVDEALCQLHVKLEMDSPYKGTADAARLAQCINHLSATLDLYWDAECYTDTPKSLEAE